MFVRSLNPQSVKSVVETEVFSLRFSVYGFQFTVFSLQFRFRLRLRLRFRLSNVNFNAKLKKNREKPYSC